MSTLACCSEIFCFHSSFALCASELSAGLPASCVAGVEGLVPSLGCAELSAGVEAALASSGDDSVAFPTTLILSDLGILSLSYFLADAGFSSLRTLRA